MAYKTDYAGLFCDILMKVEDQSDEVLESIDQIIAAGESRLLRDLDLEIFQDETAAGNLTVNNRLFTRPATVLKINALWIVVAGKRVFLEKRTKGYCDMYADDPTVQAQPVYYAEPNDNKLLFVNTPDAAYPVITYGLVRPAGLSLTVPTTWLSVNVADCLLYACLASTEEFLANPTQVATWNTDYADRLAHAKIELRGLARSDYQMARMAGQAGNPL